MKILLLITALEFLFNTVNAQRPPQGPVSNKIFNPEKEGYQLVWEDEFNGTALDSSKWKVRGVGPRAIASTTSLYVPTYPRCCPAVVRIGRTSDG